MYVFISYRREDSGASAGRLYETLSNVLGEDRLFKDVDNVGLGMDFRVEIERAIQLSSALVVVIGSNWASEDGLRRLGSENDYVRHEIALAIESRVPILPVLVDGAEMPSPNQLPPDIRSMVYRNAASLGHDTWRRDVEALIRSLQQYLDIDQTLPLHRIQTGSQPAVPISSQRPRPFPTLERSAVLKTAVLGLLAVALVGLVAVLGSQLLPDRGGDVGVAAGPDRTDSDSTEGDADSADTTESQTMSSTSDQLSTTTTEAEPEESETTPQTTAPKTTATTAQPTTRCAARVSDILDSTVGEAARTLGDAGFVPAARSAPDGNLVTGSSPASGAIVCPGETVVLESCSAAVVPRVLAHVDSVAAELQSSDLALGLTSREFNSDWSKDFVVRTSPESGERVCSGSPIDIVVSDGPPPCFVVPDVRGLPADEALATLEAADPRFDAALDYGAVREGEYELGTIFQQPTIGNIFSCDRTDYLRITVTVVGSYIPE